MKATKMKTTKFALSLLTTAILSAPSAFANESDLSSAITEGKLSANLNLRYEAVDQDNALKNADALTLRTRVNYTTGVFKGFSAAVELENSTAIVDDYNDATGEGAGFMTTEQFELAREYFTYLAESKELPVHEQDLYGSVLQPTIVKLEERAK